MDALLREAIALEKIASILEAMNYKVNQLLAEQLLHRRALAAILGGEGFLMNEQQRIADDIAAMIDDVAELNRRHAGEADRIAQAVKDARDAASHEVTASALLGPIADQLDQLRESLDGASGKLSAVARAAAAGSSSAPATTGATGASNAGDGAPIGASGASAGDTGTPATKLEGTAAAAADVGAQRAG